MTVGLSENQSNPHVTVNEMIMAVLSKDVAGASDVTLTDAEVNHAVFKFTGALSDNINVIVPTDEKIYHCWNATSGAFTLTVKTSAGTGQAVTQGKKRSVFCDGTNVEDLTDNSA